MNPLDFRPSELATLLMESDAASLKAGYSLESAVRAVCDLHSLNAEEADDLRAVLTPMQIGVYNAGVYVGSIVRTVPVCGFLTPDTAVLEESAVVLPLDSVTDDSTWPLFLAMAVAEVANRTYGSNSAMYAVIEPTPGSSGSRAVAGIPLA